MSTVRVIVCALLRFQISAIASNVKTQCVLFPVGMASHYRDQEGRIIGPWGPSQWQFLLPFTGHFRLPFTQAELRSLKSFFFFCFCFMKL
jgi:hypothetical protein